MPAPCIIGGAKRASLIGAGFKEVKEGRFMGAGFNGARSHLGLRDLGRDEECQSQKDGKNRKGEQCGFCRGFCHGGAMPFSSFSSFIKYRAHSHKILEKTQKIFALKPSLFLA